MKTKSNMTDKEKKNYQDLIIKVRSYLGMTQPQFGKMFDLSAQIISHYEKGTRKPNREVKSFIDNFIKKICVCDKCKGTGFDFDGSICNHCNGSGDCQTCKKMYFPKNPKQEESKDIEFEEIQEIDLVMTQNMWHGKTINKLIRNQNKLISLTNRNIK